MGWRRCSKHFSDTFRMLPVSPWGHMLARGGPHGRHMVAHGVPMGDQVGTYGVTHGCHMGGPWGHGGTHGVAMGTHGPTWGCHGVAMGCHMGTHGPHGCPCGPIYTKPGLTNCCPQGFEVLGAPSPGTQVRRARANAKAKAKQSQEQQKIVAGVWEPQGVHTAFPNRRHKLTGPP